MAPLSPLNLSAPLVQRAAFTAKVRGFFSSVNFLEVETPCLHECIIPERHVPSLELGKITHGKRYLLPSPELAMKHLLCQLGTDAPSLFQLAHCFRNEEELSPYHQLEFQMLEFYGMRYSTMDLLKLLVELLTSLQDLLPNLTADGVELSQPIILSFDELCLEATGLSFDSHWAGGALGMQQLYRACCSKNATVATLDDLFHLFLVDCLEPYIREHYRYIFLYPYPDATPLPAKHSATQGFSERFELYIQGVEVANGCAEENREPFLRDYAAKTGCELASSWKALPNCSGAALGLGRLFRLGNMYPETAMTLF